MSRQPPVPPKNLRTLEQTILLYIYIYIYIYINQALTHSLPLHIRKLLVLTLRLFLEQILEH